MKESGKKLSGALRKDPKNKPMQRLSPGVYRSASGGLVGQGGQQIQRQPQQNPWQSTISNMAGQTSGNFVQQTPYNNLMYTYPPGTNIQDIIGQVSGVTGQIDNNELLGSRQMEQYSQMPQPSANMGGQYRLSPGVYGNQQQAMNQYNQQMQQMYQPMTMPQVRKG